MAIIRDPSLLGLRAFEAAARRLSLTIAARELHVSQAAISRHIRALEINVGRPLFRRIHGRVELTQCGERFANELSKAFGQIRRSIEVVRGSAVSRLRISVEQAFAAHWLVPRLGGFSRKHPDIEVVLDSSDELRVLGEEADVAIRFLTKSARRPRGRTQKLFTLSGFPCVAKRRFDRHECMKDSWVLSRPVLHDDDGSNWRRWFDEAGLDGYGRLKHVHFNDYSLVLRAALSGQGVALCAPVYMGSQIRSGKLIRVGRTGFTFGDYWLLQTNHRGTAKARGAFLGWFDDEAKTLRASGGVQ